ncbi:DUF551 domain-containing protein [Methylobacterium sp. CM6244]
MDRVIGDWQPIDTAKPKTCKDFLVSCPNGLVTLAWLADDGWNDSTVPDNLDPRLDPQPTHWMPLPQPFQTGDPPPRLRRKREKDGGR